MVEDICALRLTRVTGALAWNRSRVLPLNLQGVIRVQTLGVGAEGPPKTTRPEGIKAVGPKGLSHEFTLIGWIEEMGDGNVFMVDIFFWLLKPIM